MPYTVLEPESKGSGGGKGYKILEPVESDSTFELNEDTLKSISSGIMSGAKSLASLPLQVSEQAQHLAGGAINALVNGPRAIYSAVTGKPYQQVDAFAPVGGFFQDDPGMNTDGQRDNSLTARYENEASRVPFAVDPIRVLGGPTPRLRGTDLATLANQPPRDDEDKPLPYLQSDVMKGTLQPIAEQFSPGNALLAGGMTRAPALLNKLIGVHFISKAVSEQTAETIKNPTKENFARLGTLTTLGALGTGEMMHEQQVKGPTPTEIHGPYVAPPWRQLNPAVTIPTERQLPQYAQSRGEVRTQPSSLEPIQLPQMMSQPRFVGSPIGQQVDLSQLTPPEQAELLRGPRQYEEPRQGVQTGAAQPPMIGQRPLTIEQKVVKPGEPLGSNVGSLVEEAMAFKGEPKQGGQISFEGQGVPSARQARAMVPDNIIKSRDQLSGTKFLTGIDPEDLRPAIRAAGKLLVGERGDTHADIIERHGLDAQVYKHASSDRGFVSVKEPDKFLDRQQAQQQSGIKGTAEAGGLDSLDLPDAAMHKLLRGVEEEDKKGEKGRLYSSLPVFDPDLWGRSKEVVEEMKKKFSSLLSQRGDKEGAESIKSASARQYIPKTEREKAILQNPTAKPLSRSRQTVNQPGKSLSALDEAKNVLAPVLNVAKQADRIVNPVDVIYDWLDGGRGKYSGALMENIRKPLDDDFNTALNVERLEGEPIRDLIKKGKIGPRESERIDVYLKAIQEGGKERMIASGVSPKEISNILGGLTPAEKAVARAMRDFYNKSYPILAKTALEADKLKVKEVENYSPWHREWRKYKPEADELATNPSLLTDKAKQQGVSIDDVLWPGLEATSEGRAIPGSTISRLKDAKTPIKLDAVGTFERYLRDFAHYVSMRKHLKEIAETVRKDEFAEKYGDLGQELVLEHLNTMARQGRYRRNAFFDGLRRLTGRGIIAWRLPSQVVHLANIPLAQQRAGVGWWNKGLNESLGKEGQEFLHKYFAETFARGGGEPALAEITERSARTGVGRAYNAVSRGGFWLQRNIDMLNAQATVLGIYMRRLEEKGLDHNDYHKLPVDKDAVREARVLARRAVASPIYKDVPPILTRGGTWSRTFFQFQNTFLDQWSNIRYDLLNAGVSEVIAGKPKLAMQMTLALGAMLLVESSVKHGYKEALAGATGGKLKEDDTFYKTLGHEALRRIPGMGQLMTALVYGETGVPSVDVALQPIREGIKFSKADDQAGRAIAGTRMVGSAAEALGVPGSSQALDIGVGLERSKFFKSHIERLEEETGRKVEQMDLGDRVMAEREHRMKEERLTPAQKARSAERSIVNTTKRGSELQKELSKADRQWLESRGLSLPGYDNKVGLLKERVYLTDKETKRFGELLKEGYTTVMDTLREKYDDQETDEAKEKLFALAMKAVKHSAEAQLKKEMSDSKIESNQKKGKRFSVFDPAR